MNRLSLKSCRSESFILAFLLVLVLYHLSFFSPGARRGHSISAPLSAACQFGSPDRPFVPSNTTWREITVRNPVPDSLMRLPLSSPRKFRQIQHEFNIAGDKLQEQRKRREAVQASFMRAWTSYKEKAWFKDELSPISGSFRNNYGGWGATLVDTLDTLWIMGLKEDFQQAVDAAVTIDFSDPEKLSMEAISVFETTIRFLGGFLSAYELADCKDQRLLNKATELGDMLYVAFDTPDRMPTNKWSPRKGAKGEAQPPASDDNILADRFSLSMEFTRLSQLTGDMRYFDAAQRITQHFADQQAQTKLPGMWPQRYNVETMNLTEGNSFTLGAEADSGYEYLLKMVLLLGGNDEYALQYEKMYKDAMDTAAKHMFFRPMTTDNSNVLLSGKVTVDQNGNPLLLPESEHLTCFLGGTLAMGGQILDNKSYLDIGAKLTQGCAWAYRASPSGIVPENYQTIKCPSLSSPCAWDEALWEEQRYGSFDIPKGFVAARDRRYHLRPEAIESVFYLWRITGDSAYQDIAWTMFEAIETQTKTEFGNAGLTDVFTQPAPKTDEMESFWLAETLKYLYLVFSEPELVSLDEWVLNTEAHPFRIPKG